MLRVIQCWRPSHGSSRFPDNSPLQSSNKLKPVWVGPFRVIKVVSTNAYKLQLSPESRAHPVFNVSALKIYRPNTIPSRAQPLPTVTDPEGHTRYRVEEILKSRRFRNQLQYLVKWQGYTEPTWEPEANLQDESGKNIVPLAKCLKG